VHPREGDDGSSCGERHTRDVDTHHGGERQAGAAWWRSGQVEKRALARSSGVRASGWDRVRVRWMAIEETWRAVMDKTACAAYRGERVRGPSGRMARRCDDDGASHILCAVYGAGVRSSV